MRLIGFIPAFVAETVDDLVLEICPEPVFPGQGLLDLAKQVFRTFLGLAALCTHKVVVVSFFSMMVNEMVTGIAFVYSPELFQYFKRTVNSRLVHAWHTLLNVADYFVRGDMVVCIVNNFDDQSSLWSEFEAFLFKYVQATHCNCTWMQLYEFL